MAWRMEVALLVGVQGAGKTSFYTTQLVHTHLRISRDLVRTPRREQVLYRTCLDITQPCVIDNTNPSVEARARFVAAARERGIPVVAYWFAVPLAHAMQRNAAREGAARIPDNALRSTARKMVPPSLAEGFECVIRVEPLPDRGFALLE
jgi:predicted kinase